MSSYTISFKIFKSSLEFVLYIIVCYQQYVNYIVAASLISGGNRNTQINPPTCRKSLTITLMLYRVHLAAMSGIRTTFTIRSRPRRSGPHFKRSTVLNVSSLDNLVLSWFFLHFEHSMRKVISIFAVSVSKERKLKLRQ